MNRKPVLFAAALTAIACVCSSCSKGGVNENKRFIYSPDRTYAAIVDQRIWAKNTWLLKWRKFDVETTLSVVRAEHPLTERPTTGPNPERTFLAASCCGPDFLLKWTDNSHIEVTVRECTTGHIRYKIDKIDEVSVHYM